MHFYIVYLNGTGQNINKKQNEKIKANGHHLSSIIFATYTSNIIHSIFSCFLYLYYHSYYLFNCHLIHTPCVLWTLPTVLWWQNKVPRRRWQEIGMKQHGYYNVFFFFYNHYAAWMKHYKTFPWMKSYTHTIVECNRNRFY